MKKLLFFLLTMPMFLTAQEFVQVSNPCFAGKAFTIRIPVRFPDSMTVKYRWYRNDTAVTAEATLPTGEKTIAYTVPANKAYGEEVAFHFKYCLDDECSGVWTRSPRYMVSWYEDIGCKASGGVIVGGTLNLCAAGAGGAIQGESVQLCNANAGGEIGGEAVQVCSANAGGEIRGSPVQHCNANAGGEIRGAPVQHCNANAGGEIRGIAVQVCGAGAGGVIGKK